MNKLREMIKLINIKSTVNPRHKNDRAFIETQYAKAANALRVLIKDEGCCNAMKPYEDALNEITASTDKQEQNIDFANNILDIFAGAVDIDFDRSTKADRKNKINEAISFLTILRKRYE
jgi:hypothetical protein